MGYTQYTIDLISKHLEGIKSVLDFGSQNLYAGNYDTAKPPFVSEWYRSKGIDDYTCLDLAGDNNAMKMDWAYPIELYHQFDLICDIGSSEHSVQMTEYESIPFHEGHINSIYPKGEVTEDQISKGYYNCWLNKFNLCKQGGIIISENPMMGNWPLHGYSYLRSDFYAKLCSGSDLELDELDIHAAMGNKVDGYNVVGVVKKKGTNFQDFETFNKLPIFRQ